MTDKEKAKAYDEALERARKQKYDYQKEFDKTDKSSQLAEILRAGICAIELAFPELVESEDEKIRRTLVEYFGPMAQLDLVRGVPIQKIRDWLEKHKEQEHPCDSAQFEEGFKTGLELGLRKQKEQQPAEYLDLDNASQDYVYNHFCQGADFTPDYIKGLMEDAFIDGANWQNEQKPAEWSKDDETAFGDLLWCIEQARHSAKDENDMGNIWYAEKWLKEQLKFLRPSKDCSGCAKHLEGYISGRSDAENKLLEQFGAIITPEDELHIKSRWKPSEEQMKALYCALNDAISLYSDKVSPLYEEISRTHFDALESLYNDLKKL